VRRHERERERGGAGAREARKGKEIVNAAEQYKSAIAELEEAQRALGSTPRSDPEAREAAMRVVDEATARVREAKEAVKLETTRRNFAGIGGPLHEAIVARLDPAIVVELEADAVQRQAQREERAARRRAAKATAAPPAPKPPEAPMRPSKLKRQNPAEVEILARRPRQNGGAP